MSKSISLNELKDIQRSRQGFALINVLSAEDFRKGSIPGSKNAPVEDPDFLANVATQTSGDKQMRVVVYCAGAKCDASTRAAKRLTEAGYTHVEEYRGGMEEWNASSSGGRGQRDTGAASRDAQAPAREHQPQARPSGPEDKAEGTPAAKPPLPAKPEQKPSKSEVHESPRKP